jgi:hypothetical protein
LDKGLAILDTIVMSGELVRRTHHELLTAGYGETEILDGWVEARLAAYTESSGLGRDRLTELGRRLAVTD